MKKNLFWKIMAILLFLLLCVWLWNSSIYIYQPKLEVMMKHNKLTGAVYMFSIKTNKWVKFKRKQVD